MFKINTGLDRIACGHRCNRYPDHIWTVKMWTVKTGLGLGLVMTVQILNVQIKTANRCNPYTVASARH